MKTRYYYVIDRALTLGRKEDSELGEILVTQSPQTSLEQPTFDRDLCPWH